MTTPPKKSSSNQIHHIHHLNAQREHLLVLQEYLRSMSHSVDPTLTSNYLELADLLGKAATQYASIVHTLQGRVDGK